MSKGLFCYEQPVIKYDEERLRATFPLDPRAMLRRRGDLQTISLRPNTKRSPEVVKQEEDDVPLGLPLKSVIVKNKNDLARFTPLTPGRGQERGAESSEEGQGEESEGEESEGGEGEGGEGEGEGHGGGHGEGGAEVPGCSEEEPAAENRGPRLTLFNTDQSDDCDTPAKRTGRDDEEEEEEEELTLQGVGSKARIQDARHVVLLNGMRDDVRQGPAKDQERPGGNPGRSSDASSSQTHSNSAPGSLLDKDLDERGSPPAKPQKERRRAPATFNGTVDKTKHQCSECHKYFQCEAHLQRHMLIHYGLKPFECPVCDKAFRYKSSYKAHLNMHTEDKPLTCSLCRKGFTQSRDLKRHMLSHTDEKNFNCPECGGKFKHKHNLIRHISVIHKAEKPYPCPMCEKAFAQKHDFMTHMRTHSGEKPFSCHVCSRSFGAKGTLRTHMKVHRKRVPKELPGVLAFDDFLSEDKNLCD